MQAVLFLPLKCAGGTILGKSMPAPLLLPLLLLLLLNHSQCASPSWPRTERERKLLVRDGILIPILLYSGKLSREKTFANFVVLWLYLKVFSAKFGAWCPLALQKRAIHEIFLRGNCIFTNSRKFPSIRYYNIHSTNSCTIHMYSKHTGVCGNHYSKHR